MSMKQRFYELLANDGPLNALVHGRIFPVKQFVPVNLMTAQEKADNLPQIFYSVSSGQSVEEDINGKPLTLGYNCQCDIFGLDKDVQVSIEEALRKLLDGYQDTWVENQELIDGIFWDSNDDVEEAEGFHSMELYAGFLATPA